MKIPYGICNFDTIRSEGFFYADKTPFLPVLEAAYRHLVFLRPRRFGKSTLVSMLEHYYDLGRRDRFDALFGGLWIHDHPTAEQGAYLVLTLDFSRVATDRGRRRCGARSSSPCAAPSRTSCCATASASLRSAISTRASTISRTRRP